MSVDYDGAIEIFESLSLEGTNFAKHKACHLAIKSLEQAKQLEEVEGELKRQIDCGGESCLSEQYGFGFCKKHLQARLDGIVERTRKHFSGDDGDWFEELLNDNTEVG